MLCIHGRGGRRPHCKYQNQTRSKPIRKSNLKSPPFTSWSCWAPFSRLFLGGAGSRQQYTCFVIAIRRYQLLLVETYDPNHAPDGGAVNRMYCGVQEGPGVVRVGQSGGVQVTRSFPPNPSDYFTPCLPSGCPRKKDALHSRTMRRKTGSECCCNISESNLDRARKWKEGLLLIAGRACYFSRLFWAPGSHSTAVHKCSATALTPFYSPSSYLLPNSNAAVRKIFQILTPGSSSTILRVLPPNTYLSPRPVGGAPTRKARTVGRVHLLLN